MGHGVYGLGVDIGDATVVAAISRAGDGATAPQVLLLDGAAPAVPATVRLDGEGRLLPFDHPEPGRPQDGVLAANALSRIGGPSPYCTGRAAVPAIDVLSALVREVCTRATEQEGFRPASVALVVPPSWGEHRRTLVATAVARAVDLPCAVVSAAEAVVQAQARSGRLSDGSVVAVYDLGASTLDTAVVEVAAGGTADHRTAPRPPLPWGGRDIDDAVLAHVLESLLPVHRARGPDLPAQLGRALRAHCTAAKESLSTETVVRLPIDLPDVPRSSLRLTRQELEERVAEPLADSVEALRDAARDAEVDVADLDAVVLSGGGARIPLVAETLSAHLERPIVVDEDPELTAARGAALLALAMADTEEPDRDEAPSSGADARATASPDAEVAAPGIRRTQGRGRPSAAVRRPPNPRQSAAAAARRRRTRQGVVVLGAVGTLLILPTSRLGTLAGDSIGLSTDQRAQAAEDLPPAGSAAAPGEPAAVVPADDFAGVSAVGSAQATTPTRSEGTPGSVGAGATPGAPPAAAPAAGPAVAAADRTAGSPAPPVAGATPATETPPGSGTQDPPAPGTSAPSTTAVPGSPLPPLPPIPPSLPEVTETTTTDPAPPSEAGTESAPPPDPTTEAAPPQEAGTESAPPSDPTAEAAPQAEAAVESTSEPEPTDEPVGPGPTEMA